MQQTLKDQPIIQLSSYASYTDAIMQRCETWRQQLCLSTVSIEASISTYVLTSKLSAREVGTLSRGEAACRCHPAAPGQER